MKRQANEDMDKEEIAKNIDELRDVLNEICAKAQGAEELKKRLIVSELLDKLIVKYMSENNP